MKKIISLLCFAVIAFSVSAQHYPDVYVNAGPDLSLPCGNNCRPLTASYLNSGAPTSYVGSVIPNFTPYPDTLGIAPPAPFYTQDDYYSGVINIPFRFCFFGNTYTQCVIGNNAMISFDVSLAGQTNPWPLQGTAQIPSPTQPRNAIFGPYMDIIPGSLAIQDSNFVNYATFGTAPNRRFVVSYHRIPFFSTGTCPGQFLTSQIVLYETTNVIEIYIGDKGTCTGWNGALALEGIQDAAGTTGYAVPGRNVSVWSAHNDGYRYTPTGATNVAIDWYSGGVHLASGPTVTVCPPNNRSTTYVATATYFGCDSARTIIADTMRIDVLQPAGPTQYLSCPSPTSSVTMNGTGTGTWHQLNTNPASVTIVDPNLNTTQIVGFSTPGDYGFAWLSGLCEDTAHVIVTPRADAGPDQNKCKNDTAMMNAYGTGIWTAMNGNPSTTVITTPARNSTTITGFTAGGAYSFIWTTQPGCSDTMIVNIPFFTITPSAGTNVVCQYANTTVSVTAATAALGPFQYVWLDSQKVQSPYTSSTLVNAVPGNTYYHIQVTSNDGCKLTDSVLVSTSALIGTNIRASGSPTTVCPGDPVQLLVLASPNGCGLATTPCTAPGTNATIGTGTSVQNGAGSIYPSPYGNYYKSAHHQFLIRASELLSQVSSGGQIKSLTLDIATLNGAPALSNFTVKLACVGADSLNGFIALGSLVQVYSAATYQPVNGLNTHTFATPYNWDGQSNLVVDICFNSSSGGATNPKMRYTTTPFRSIWCTYNNDPGGMCGIIGTQPGNNPLQTNRLYQRPNMKFNMCITDLSGANLQWTPGGAPNGAVPATNDTAIAHPLTTTTYQVALTSGNGCINYDYVTINVDTTTRLTFSNDTFICSVQPIQLNASVTGAAVNPATITYTWTASTGTPPPSGTGASFANPLVNPTATTLYTVRTTGGGGCSLFDSMRVTLGNGLPVNKVVDSITCAGANNGRIDINMNAGIAPFTYVWTPTGSGSGDTAVNLGPGTYIVQITDAQGCGGRDTTTLTAPLPLTLVLDSTNVLCYGDNNGTVTALAGGGRAPYVYIWTPSVAGTTSLTGLSAGAYRLDLTDAGNCTISGTVHVTQPAQLVSSAIATSLSGAGTNDGTITVTTSGGTPGYTYVSSPSISGLPNATGLDTGIYIITVCDAHNCCVQDTAHVTGPPPIQVVATITNNQCYGQCAGQISVTAAGGVGPYTFQWNTSPVTYSDTARNLCAGSYTVVVRDANGISVAQTYPVTAPPAIGIAIDSVPITCFGANNGQLDAIPSGGTPNYSVTWSTGADPLSGLSPGMYIVTVTDANLCSAMDTAYLGEPTQVVATIASTDSVKCFGDNNGRARISATGGRPPYTYQWTGSTSQVDSATDLSAGAFSVVVTDASGCTGTVAGTIGQPLQIQANVTTTAAHCSTSDDGAASASATNGTPPYTYTWDGTLGNSAISGLTAGSHTIIVADANGCSTQQTFTIDTIYVLRISLVADSANCHSGNDGQITVTTLNGTPGYTFLWSDGGINDGNNPAVDLIAGVYTATVTDAHQCVAIASAEVFEPSEIVVLPTFTNPLCTGDANGKIWLTASGGQGPYSFTYGGNTYQMTDTVTNLAASYPASYNLILTDVKGCVQPIAVYLTDPPVLSISDQVTPIACANDNNGAITVSGSGGTPPYVFAWGNGGANDATRDNLAPGTYTISVTDANGCEKDITEILVAPPLITVTSLIGDSTNCPGSADGHIYITVSGGTPGTAGAPYQYSIDDSVWQDDPNFYNLPAGAYHVYARDGRGCILEATTNIFEPMALTLAIDPLDTTVVVGSSMPLTSLIGNLTTQNINSYAWSPATGLSCIDCPNPVATPYETTTYTLVVNYGKNCFVNASAVLHTDHAPDAYIPNAFTPNGDGNNDRLEVFGTGLKSVTMRIFNRWGEKIFDSGTEQWASWDGMYRDTAQPTGVYTYVVELVYLDGQKKTREGSITLIR